MAPISMAHHWRLYKFLSTRGERWSSRINVVQIYTGIRWIDKVEHQPLLGPFRIETIPSRLKRYKYIYVPRSGEEASLWYHIDSNRMEIQRRRTSLRSRPIHCIRPSKPKFHYKFTPLPRNGGWTPLADRVISRASTFYRKSQNRFGRGPAAFSLPSGENYRAFSKIRRTFVVARIVLLLLN